MEIFGLDVPIGRTMRTRKGRRPRGNPLQKLLSKRAAVIARGTARMGISINTLPQMEKLGWKRVN